MKLKTPWNLAHPYLYMLIHIGIFVVTFAVFMVMLFSMIGTLAMAGDFEDATMAFSVVGKILSAYGIILLGGLASFGLDLYFMHVMAKYFNGVTDFINGEIPVKMNEIAEVVTSATKGKAK